MNRVIAPKECIICGYQAKEGRELRRHLLARHHVVGSLALQRGRPLVLTRDTLRYVDDQNELYVLFDKFFPGERRRRNVSQARRQSTSPIARGTSGDQSIPRLPQSGRKRHDEDTYIYNLREEERKGMPALPNKEWPPMDTLD